MEIPIESVIGADLNRPTASFISKYVIQPQVVHDYNSVPGNEVRLKRFALWNDAGTYTETARERLGNQILGTGGNRGIDFEEVFLRLKEFTGPSAGDTNNPSAPGNLKITKRTLIEAQRKVYDLSRPDQFHNSIGSNNLINDYQKWQDRVYINRALSANPFTETSGQVANDRQGGYYNPGGVLNGGTYNASTGAPVMDVVRDVTQIVSDMRTRLAIPFQTSMGDCYHALCTPGFMLALRRDPEFRKAIQYPGVPAVMLSQGMTPMSAVEMPDIINWAAAPNMQLMAGGCTGQTGYMHRDVMPMGILFEGIRFFESTNIPRPRVTFATSGLASQGFPDGSNTYDAEIAIIVGQNVIGEGVWGNGPEVKIHTDNDWDRFFMVMWQQYSGYTILHQPSVTVLRTLTPRFS